MPPFAAQPGGTGSMAAATTSANQALPPGAGLDFSVFNGDAANDAFIEFGLNNQIIATIPVDGTAAPGGSLLVPHGMTKPMIISAPVGSTFWACVSRAGTPRVTITRGRWF